jgi:hypothetical protein
MSLLCFWLASQEEKEKSKRMIIQLIFAGVLALALFLAFKDLSLLSNASTKFWVVLLALVFPELYICLHGISTSSMGVNFFSGSPVESRMSGGDWFKPPMGPPPGQGPPAWTPSDTPASPLPNAMPSPTESSSSLF